MPQPTLLGIAASLRNARWGAGGRNLIEALAACSDKPALLAYLSRESELHTENFLQAGRREGKSFLEIHRNLTKMRGDAGLSNSEVALAAALWAAMRKGVAVDHLSLSEVFSTTGEVRRPDELRRALLAADGLLISGPVYFGDRGSLAESLIDFIARDRELAAAMRGRVYGGIAIGAKRNGGQETTLIYQMIDMLALGLLAVGNDSDTTAQYGGTGHAGDIGSMHKDGYGIDTSMGVGRRMADVLSMLTADVALRDVPNVLFLVLQDVDGLALADVNRLIAQAGRRMNATVIDVTKREIKRCLACDICPTHIDLDEVYRCIIKSEGDDLSGMHSQLLNHDMLVPVVATARDRTRVVSAYQTFVERTRYIRRGDYIWSNLLVMPIAYTEPGAFDTYAIRMMTSFLRHHTVLFQPQAGLIEGGRVTNGDTLFEGLLSALANAERLIAGRLAGSADPLRRYNPVGYVLSVDKETEDQRLDRRRTMVQSRINKLHCQAARHS